MGKSWNQGTFIPIALSCGAATRSYHVCVDKTGISAGVQVPPC